MFKSITKYLILFIITIIGLLIFIPRSYDTLPFQQRPNTNYWNLSTGSRIGYFFIPSKLEKQRSPIIYLHGGPGGQVSDHHIKSLKPLSTLGYDIYFYDQVGSGHSGRLENIEEYTVERHVKDLEEIVKKIGSEKVILIAQSWGALLATQFLLNNSEKVEKMILTGPGPILPIRRNLTLKSPPDSLNLKAPRFSNQQANEKANNWRTQFTQKWAYISGQKLMQDSEADNFFTYLNNELNKSTFCNPEFFENSHGGVGYYSHIMTIKSFYSIKNNRDKLKRIKTPILILRGQCDNQKWGFVAEYIEIFQNSKLEIIENAGHSIWIEKPQRYLTIVEEYLR